MSDKAATGTIDPLIVYCYRQISDAPVFSNMVSDRFRRTGHERTIEFRFWDCYKQLPGRDGDLYIYDGMVLSALADTICAKKDVRIILLCGGSSAGKTTTAKRLCTQLRVNGANALHLSTDDYFVGDARNPRHPDGTFDYETIEAVDSARLASDVNALLAGEEVHLRRFDFINHEGFDSEGTTTMPENGYIVLEGIHALNPILTDAIPESAKFRIFINTVTSISLDDHNCIPTSDNRLLRRIVRDFNKGAYTARETISNWPNVRRAEVKWIYPYQETADVIFNSAYLAEFAVLRTHAERILATVPKNCAEYSEAHRLLMFLHYFVPVSDKELPPTSLIRSFID